jgi:hypothetical protein
MAQPGRYGFPLRGPVVGAKQPSSPNVGKAEYDPGRHRPSGELKALDLQSSRFSPSHYIRSPRRVSNIAGGVMLRRRWMKASEARRYSWPAGVVPLPPTLPMPSCAASAVPMLDVLGTAEFALYRTRHSVDRRFA